MKQLLIQLYKICSVARTNMHFYVNMRSQLEYVELKFDKLFYQWQTYKTLTFSSLKTAEWNFTE